LLDSAKAPLVYRLLQEKLLGLGIRDPSLTFHGRDIFAPIAADIAAGRIRASQIGERTDRWTPGWVDEPEVTAKRVSGTIITVDTFGNLISNIDQELLRPFSKPAIHLGGHRFNLEATYGRVRPGDYLGLINSFGVVEVARAEGSAADGLGVDRGAPVVVSDAT
jgi:S-adenosylmethionine hydrolase